MNLFFPLKKGMSHQQWRQKESKQPPTPQKQNRKKREKKLRERERERDTRYLNQLVFNKKYILCIVSLNINLPFHAWESQSHLGLIKRAQMSGFSVQKVQKHERGGGGRKTTKQKPKKKKPPKKNPKKNQKRKKTKKKKKREKKKKKTQKIPKTKTKKQTPNALIMLQALHKLF